MGLKDYFAFTRGEKRGALVLLIIIAILISAQFIPNYLKKTSKTDFSEFEAEINEFEKSKTAEQPDLKKNLTLFDFNPNTISDSEWVELGFKGWQIKTINNYKSKGGNWKTKQDVSKIYGLSPEHFEQLKPFILLPESIDKNNSFTKDKKAEVNYFEFNPNIITDSQWKQLGFSDWQIKSINKYKAKGGKWKTKNDVSKIYGLSNDEFEKLKPHILLPDEIKKSSSSIKDFTKKVDINKADAKEFTNLKGIFSEKYGAVIVKYRNSLGGFVKKEQLLEVWNMKKETYDGFSSQIILQSTSPKQININTASAEELKKHPYIYWNTANAIVKYRKANGNYNSVNDVKKIHLISEELYSKIAPYLKTK